MMYTTTLDIDGMMCGMCESHINEVIRANFAVKSVKSSHSKNRTVVCSEEALDEDALRSCIAETGYELRKITSEESSSKKRFKFFG